jgi:hypothetical protein
MGCTSEDLGLCSQQGKNIVLFSTGSRPALGMLEVVSLEVRRQRLETDHSPSPNAEVKSASSFTSLLPYMLCLIEHRNSFTFTYTFTHTQGVDKVMETLRNLGIKCFCIVYIERTSVGNTESSPIYLLSVVLVSVH